MVCFIIALMNRDVASDWSKVEENFNNTLHSIFNQTDDDFKVYVGYTDMPKLYETYDERLVMIPCNTHTPIERIEKLRDRGWKLSVCANAIYNNFDELATTDGGVFVFPVDADDLVNNKIAKHVKNYPEANGFKSPKSYIHKSGNKYLDITPWFGGTMNIMKLHKDELTKELPDVSLCFDYETACELHKCPVRWTDFEVEQLFADMGRPFTRLPFRSTIYVLGTGENLSNSDPNNTKGKTKRFHPVAWLRRVSPFNKKFITPKIKKEFGIKDTGFNQ